MKIGVLHICWEFGRLVSQNLRSYLFYIQMYYLESENIGRYIYLILHFSKL